MHNLKQILIDLKNKSSTKEGRTELNKTYVFGICNYVRQRTHDETTLGHVIYDLKLENLFDSWEHFSGNYDFPIEGGYDMYMLRRHDPFNPNLDYCKLRLNLLDHCIGMLPDE